MQKGKYKYLTNTEREEISRCLANKQPFAHIPVKKIGKQEVILKNRVFYLTVL